MQGAAAGRHGPRASAGSTHSGDVVGAALVLYRRRTVNGRSFAHIPEGPLIDWSDKDLSRWLQPLLDHLRAAGAFAAQIGPPLPLRTWEAETLKQAIAAGQAKQVADVTADATAAETASVAAQMTATGWSRGGLKITGRGDIQPRLVFELPLAERVDDVWAGFNQQWRRNIRKAQKAGVQLSIGGYDDLPVFYELLKITQQRDGFDLGRSLAYYQRQYKALTAEDPSRIRLYLATHDGEVLAAHTMNIVGTRACYHLGASASHRREVRASRAVQWQMIRDAHAQGCSLYDMRGFPDSLDSNDRACGLLQWKLGTGGRAVEYLGEWDYPINRLVYTALKWYLTWRRRAAAGRHGRRVTPAGAFQVAGKNAI